MLAPHPKQVKHTAQKFNGGVQSAATGNSTGFKAISIDIPNVADIRGVLQDKKGGTLRSTIASLTDEYPVEITYSINLLTSTLSVVISGPNKDVDSARAQLLRKASPSVTRYIFADSSFILFALRKLQSDGSEARVILYNNGDPISAFISYKNGSISESDILYSGEDPIFSLPGTPFEGKSLIEIKGIHEDIPPKWESIYKLSQEALPMKYASIPVDRSLILLISLDDTPNAFLHLLNSNRSTINIGKSTISVKIPPIFPVTDNFSSMITLYGPTQVINSALESLKNSISDLIATTCTSQVSLNMKFHRTLAGDNCSNIPYILLSTGCSVCFPPYSDGNNYVTVRARTMKEIENTKRTIQGIISNSKNAFYDINLTSLDLINTHYLEHVYSYLRNCKSREISEFELKYGCKVFQFTSDSHESYWSKIISVECNSSKKAEKIVSELTTIINSSLKNLIFEQVNIPSLLLSTLHINPDSVQFVSSGLISKNASQLLGILCLPQSRPFINLNPYKSENFSTKAYLIIKCLPSHNGIDQTNGSTTQEEYVDAEKILEITTQLFNNLKSISDAQISFYSMPPNISVRFYSKIMKSSVIPFLEKASASYSLEYPDVVDLTIDFTEQNGKCVKKSASGPSIVLCAQSNRLDNIEDTLDDILISWSEVVSKRLDTISIPVPGEATYSSFFINPRKKEAELNEIMDLAYEQLGFKNQFDDSSDNVSQTMEKEQLLHNFSVRLVRPQATSKTSSSSEADVIVITGFAKVVNVVSQIIKERMQSHGDKTQVRIPVIPQLSDTSKQIIDSHNLKLSLLNRVIFGSSGAVRNLLQEIRNDNRIKLGFVKSAELTNNETIGMLPADAYILWAAGSKSEISAASDNIFKVINDELSKYFTVKFEVPRLSSPLAVSLSAQEVNDIKKKFDVVIHTPEAPNRDSSSSKILVKITGKSKSVSSAKDLYMKVRTKYSTLSERRVYIPWYMHGIITGHGGEKIKSIVSSLNGGKSIFISVAPDTRNVVHNPKYYYSPDTVAVSSFEDTFPKVVEGLINSASKKSSGIRELIRRFALIEDPQNDTVSHDGIYVCSIILPSGMNNDQHSTFMATLRNYAFSLSDTIIRSNIFPSDDYNNLHFEGSEELKKELSDSKFSDAAGSILHLFGPAVKYTIISEGKKSLEEVEKYLKNSSSTLLDYGISDDRQKIFSKFDSIDTKFSPALDFFRYSVSELENFLHLAFQVRLSDDNHPYRVLLRTLSGWKSKLTEAVDGILEHLQNLKHFCAIFIQINGNDVESGEGHATAEYRVAEIYDKLKKKIVDETELKGARVFDVYNYPAEYDNKFVKLYIGLDKVDIINGIPEIVKRLISFEFGLICSPNASLSMISDELSLLKVLMTGYSPEKNARSTDISGTVRADFKSVDYQNAPQYSTNTDTHGIIVDLSRFISDIPDASGIPEVTKDSTPIIDVGLSSKLIEDNPPNGVNANSCSRKLQHASRKVDIKSKRKTYLHAPVTHNTTEQPALSSHKSPITDDNNNISSSLPPPLKHTNLDAKSTASSAFGSWHPRDESDQFILKGRKRKVTLAYKSLGPLKEQVKSKDNSLPSDRDISANRFDSTAQFAVGDSSHPPPSIRPESAESNQDDICGTGVPISSECLEYMMKYADEEDEINTQDNIDNDMQVISTSNEVQIENSYSEGDNRSDDFEKYVSPRSSLFSLSYKTSHSSDGGEELIFESAPAQDASCLADEAVVGYDHSTTGETAPLIQFNTPYYPSSEEGDRVHPLRVTSQENRPPSEWKEVGRKKTKVSLSKPTTHVKATTKTKPKPQQKGSFNEENSYYLGNDEAEKLGSDAPLASKASEKRKKRQKKRKDAAGVAG